MERHPSFEELVEMARNPRQQPDPRSAAQEGLVNHPMIDRPSTPRSAAPLHNLAVSAELRRSVEEAKYEALETLHGAVDFAKQSIGSLAELNWLLAMSDADPDMIEMKQTLGKELKDKLKRFVRRGSGVTEEKVTINHRQQRY